MMNSEEKQCERYIIGKIVSIRKIISWCLNVLFPISIVYLPDCLSAVKFVCSIHLYIIMSD